VCGVFIYFLFLQDNQYKRKFLQKAFVFCFVFVFVVLVDIVMSSPSSPSPIKRRKPTAPQQGAGAKEDLDEHDVRGVLKRVKPLIFKIKTPNAGIGTAFPLPSDGSGKCKFLTCLHTLQHFVSRITPRKLHLTMLDLIGAGEDPESGLKISVPPSDVSQSVQEMHTILCWTEPIGGTY